MYEALPRIHPGRFARTACAHPDRSMPAREDPLHLGSGGLDEEMGNWRGFALVAVAIIVGAALIAVIADDGPTRRVASQAEVTTTTSGMSATTGGSGSTSTTRPASGATSTTGATATTSATTATTAAGTARTQVRLGSRGSDVTVLQQKLAAAGYNPGTADGVFGQSTQTALIDFQKAKGLTADGVAGSSTWAALG